MMVGSAKQKSSVLVIERVLATAGKLIQGSTSDSLVWPAAACAAFVRAANDYKHNDTEQLKIYCGAGSSILSSPVVGYVQQARLRHTAISPEEAATYYGNQSSKIEVVVVMRLDDADNVSLKTAHMAIAGLGYCDAAKMPDGSHANVVDSSSITNFFCMVHPKGYK